MTQQFISCVSWLLICKVKGLGLVSPKSWLDLISYKLYSDDSSLGATGNNDGYHNVPN